MIPRHRAESVESISRSNVPAGWSIASLATQGAIALEESVSRLTWRNAKLSVLADESKLWTPPASKEVGKLVAGVFKVEPNRSAGLADGCTDRPKLSSRPEGRQAVAVGQVQRCL